LATGATTSDTFGGILNHSAVGALEKKTHASLPGHVGWKNHGGDLDA